MQAPPHRRSLPTLQRKLEQALASNEIGRIHAAATNLAHVACWRGAAGRQALCQAGAAFARLAAQGDAPSFAALDAALCLRAGVAENEHEGAGALATDDVPDGQPTAELCARWALADRWRDLAVLPEPDGTATEGPFGIASADVALAAWHHARREGLPLNPVVAEAAAEAEHEAWERVRDTLRPLYESLPACRANLLWLALVGQPAETRDDGALDTRLRRAQWRFWSVRVDVGDPERRLIIHDRGGVGDGAPDWIAARGATDVGPQRRWWGVHAPSGIATWDRGPLSLADALLAAGVAQQALEWLKRFGWNLRIDIDDRMWRASRDTATLRAATLAALVDQVRLAIAAEEERAAA